MVYVPHQEALPGALMLNPIGFRNPQEVNLQYEDISITCSDEVKLNAWFIGQEDKEYRSKCFTVLYFHGNAGNIGTRLPYAKQLYDEMKVNILFVDYRGYGNSEGYPSEIGLQRDSIASLEYLKSRNDIDKKKIVVFGRSIGGNVAVHLASLYSNDLSGIIIENSFSSIADMGISLFPLLKFIKIILPFFLFSHWNSIKKIPKIKCPMLLLCSIHDDVVPHDQMMKIVDTAKNRKDCLTVVHLFEKGNHNTIPEANPQEYVEQWKSFLNIIEEKE